MGKWKMEQIQSTSSKAPFFLGSIAIKLAGEFYNNGRDLGTSLVAQWLRIRLPMQGTRVRALVRENTTCPRATKPVRHNYWACALEPTSHDYWAMRHNYWSPRTPEPACCNHWACALQLLRPACLEPMLHNKRSHRNEKPAHPNEE